MSDSTPAFSGFFFNQLQVIQVHPQQQCCRNPADNSGMPNSSRSAHANSQRLLVNVSMAKKQKL